jgi:DNA ligase-1
MFLFNVHVNRLEQPYSLLRRLACISVLALCSICVKAQSPPSLQLANVYRSDITIKDYWVSEKLDGVRAYWDGARFISKNGNTYVAPAWFTKNLPDFALDGELWIARHTFDELSGIVRKKEPIDLEWRKVSYQVFDLPQNTATFDERLRVLKQFFGSGSATQTPENLVLIKQFKVRSHADLMNELDRVTKLGGEGLMLHLGASNYHGRRDDDLLKLKQYFDAEAKVIEYYPGKGKYRGMLGAILAETVDDSRAKIRFRIGSGFSDSERRAPPPIGAVISYKYFGYTKSGLPKFPSYLRVRSE